MTADQLKTLTTDALDTLATLLDEKHSERLTALLKTMGPLPSVLVSQSLSHHRPVPDGDARRGLSDLAHEGRFVRRGEKGIAILAPIVGRRMTDVANDDSKTVLGFRAAYVFDIASTDGKPLPPSRSRRVILA